MHEISYSVSSIITLNKALTIMGFTLPKVGILIFSDLLFSGFDSSIKIFNESVISI